MGAFVNTFGNSPRVAVLEALVENVEHELSGPDLINITGKAKRAVYYTLKRLVEEGVIVQVSKKRPMRFRLNANDARAAILPYMESILVLGQVESIMKHEAGIPQFLPLPGSAIMGVMSPDVGQIRHEPETTVTIPGKGKGWTTLNSPIALNKQGETAG